MIRSKWDQRIRRADQLAAAHPFAAEVLRFYGHVVRLQEHLYTSTRDVNKFPSFLRDVARVAPEPLAKSARELQQHGAAYWEQALATFWDAAPSFQPEPGREAELLISLFLQPCAEYQAGHSQPHPPRETYGTCPHCTARPIVGVLRQEGDGGKRSLICAWCATEWNIGRIVCPACGEQDVAKLAVYTAGQFPHVRVEACDTCRYYIKTVDLTKDGHAVPVVDELATLPLNLWAQQHDYIKLHPNLLGI